MKRKCGICKQPAQYATATAAWCSQEHGKELALKGKERADARKAKADRKALAEDRKRVEPIGAVLARVQKACNAYIRERDYGMPCITCGKHAAIMDAGHYKAVGRSNSPARFSPSNINLQCRACNVYGGGGNHPNYRPNLVERIGEEAVQEVEELHKRTVKWNREALEIMAANFRVLTRELTARREALTD